MSLLESPSFIEQTGPLKSSSLPCDAYVLAIAAVGSYYAVSASAPSHKIFLFDRSSLRTFRSFEGHEGGTTSLRAVDSLAGVNQRVIISSGKDGVVRVWDDRTSATAIESTCCVRDGSKRTSKRLKENNDALQCHLKGNRGLSFPATYLRMV